ncbi:MAG: thiol:disulfide interchange protein, partial [Bacteroidaceae bacterium]|nr:thiol:disulfide interchange protein [Bacteroidaceae bacterium]
MKRFILAVVGLLLAITALPQIQEPVTFTQELRKVSATEAEIIFTGKIDKGWHVYSTDLGDGGPIAATLEVEQLSGATLDGKLTPRGNEISDYDKLFEMQVRWFENEAQFVQRLKLTGGPWRIEGYLEYGACNDQNCLPPTDIDFSFSGTAEMPTAVSATPVATSVAVTEPLPIEETPTAVVASTDTPTVDASDGVGGIGSALWAPVVDQLQALGETSGTTDRSWLYIFFAGFLGGLLALFTPCVWPIIPMTVSFFLKRSKDKKKGIRDAITYGLAIIVIYVTLGLAVTLIFGASALNALSTNAIFNIFFFLMLVVFAASFFGAFEITLPSKWTTAVDNKAEETTGLISIFLMAFTLSLVSFSCTGPIIGFLLVEVSTTGSILAPTIGMLGFAIALALPFTLFALFPTWLKQMP